MSDDGERFLMIRERSGQRGATISVVLDWFAEVAAAAPSEEH